MRIVGGAFRGRQLVFPPAGTAIRPTAGRSREAIFDILLHRFQSADWTLSAAWVVDVFAGTGAMGFEALSHGAAYVTFIDHAPAAQTMIRANRYILGVERQSALLAQDALRLPLAARACTLAFLDPPYEISNAPAALTALWGSGWLEKGALCVVEQQAGRTIELPTCFRLADTRTYGKTAVLFLWVLE